ncbi:50S ribosomal protein L4 [uncultured Nocardioides sp.]|uniref:Large ribosomal subunit protein uL4 n=1 Tax=uncultured Nocardioides sp. TaxID=198441 RepID=A0A6J4N7L5_9ACTN|nr:MAG: LSU ribosomal protein L4p (L1e) [uncultured Nocardioides sp.]
MAAKTLKVDLPAEIFDVEVNIPLIHQVVIAQQAAARQGTASTKRRGEVRGGGRKPYKQKGTGRARQGSTRAPQFAGGGIVHGPKPRDYDQRTPKKMKAAALRGALSDRAREGRIHVVDSLVSGDVPSTKSALAALAGLTDRVRHLVVLERTDAVTWLSLRNAQQVHIVAVDQLNTYDVLASDDVVFTQGAYDAFVSKAPTSAERPVSRRAPAVEAPAADTVTEPAQAPVDEADVETAEGLDTETETVEAEAEVELPQGAKAPLKSGNAPKGYEVKGAAGTYHAPDDAGYDAAVAEVWFKSVDDAEAAGLSAADKEGEK